MRKSDSDIEIPQSEEGELLPEVYGSLIRCIPQTNPST